MIVGIVFAALLLIWVILSMKYPIWFGSFKKKFLKFEISQYFYVFSSSERLITAILIICLSPGCIAAGVLAGIFAIEAIFIAIKKPYVLGFWKRPFLNKILTAIISLLYVGASLTATNSKINEYIPIGILLVLIAVLVVNTIGSIQELK